MSDLLTEHLKREEGFRRSAYRDHLGYLTIGYGRMIDSRRGGGITTDEGAMLLRNDVDKVEIALALALPWTTHLTEARRTILISMAYQMGIEGLLKFKHTLNHVHNFQYQQAAEGMLDSLWAKQTPERAQRMALAMATGNREELLT